MPTSARGRALVWFMLLMSMACLATLLIERLVLIDLHDAEVEASLYQEASELRSLATGNDPRTGQPFAGDARAIFDTFLRRSVPGEGEAFFTFADGQPYVRSSSAPYPLEQDPVLAQRWATLAQSEGGEIDSPAGPVRYLAVPLRRDGSTAGVFVVANFLRHEREEITTALQVGLLASGGVVIGGSVLAWLAASRLLRPVRLLTDTARSIGETGLHRRIPVTGSDEVAEMAGTFNGMLDRLEEAFSVQRAFVDDAGHELRTPLTVIRGHLELMGDEPEEQRETLALVLDELDRMGRIVDHLLLLAKVEQPDFVRPAPLELETFTRGLLAKAQTLGHRQWRYEGSGGGEVEADGQRLTQALMNLAQNAVQHTDVDQVVGLGSAVTNGEARFWVRDTGPGVPPEDEERIFERFARGTGGPRRSEGAGLGLAIVKAVAEAHGGRVELRSRPGWGALFTVVIPRAVRRS